jgi:hypothetical protein
VTRLSSGKHEPRLRGETRHPLVAVGAAVGAGQDGSLALGRGEVAPGVVTQLGAPPGHPVLARGLGQNLRLGRPVLGPGSGVGSSSAHGSRWPMAVIQWFSQADRASEADSSRDSNPNVYRRMMRDGTSHPTRSGGRSRTSRRGTPASTDQRDAHGRSELHPGHPPTSLPDPVLPRQRPQPRPPPPGRHPRRPQRHRLDATPQDHGTRTRCVTAKPATPDCLPATGGSPAINDRSTGSSHCGYHWM